MEIPVLKDEVARKAMLTIEKMVSDLNMGKITKAQYKYGIDVLWSALSGLADNDFFEIIGVMGEEVASTKTETKIFMRNERGALVRIYSNHIGLVTVYIWVDGAKSSKEFNYSEEPIPSVDSKEKVKALVQQFHNKGFMPI